MMSAIADAAPFHAIVERLRHIYATVCDAR